jgi:uncharacterized protein
MYLGLSCLLGMLIFARRTVCFHTSASLMVAMRKPFELSIRQPMRHQRAVRQSSASSSEHHDNDKATIAIEATNIWMRSFVLGNKLCPWIGRAIADKAIRLIPLEDESEEKMTLKVYEEVLLLAKSNLTDSNSHKTTLLVIPRHTAFDSFLELIDCIEHLIENEKMDEFVQIASFHPDYQFGGTSYEDEGNWTNRSPYPVIHLLQVDDVATAIEAYKKQFGSTDLIWENNIKTMQAIGIQALKNIHARIVDQAKANLKQKHS